MANTFQMLREKDFIKGILKENSENDNAKNAPYPILDKHIGETYVAQSRASNIRSLYDSYIRAIRWTSDHIDNAGIIGFVSGSDYVEKSTIDGLQKCLAKEFTNIDVLNLRGDLHKNMFSNGRAQKEQNIFGSGRMAGITVTLFIKNPNVSGFCKIYSHNIGDNLITKEKLNTLKSFCNVDGISS
ncbi:putative helicase [Bartonella silvatica]|uniref:Helicase n=1 Tax=Bartonella silvatica TaxID=357760 RepID=A0ABV2HF49_9HYPH